ncbi:TAXI family TRAP transporter solute-binding subunit [Egibacter rhizosphaerae]|uniref:TAXI family TRAP transporter solute-binding subunit n=1 Tax=Egibacter rhizosphaerae TaxID=1670831 RepID=A0A411YDV0_9ACTN|nr:TAXI family TRAP transporter solute-binding subunit [Egibacter rhizosphaerae]QBI19414.1 TAXI family TRAP transporter solute-binding subunit [Egibacter rhizosphaerae]
MTTHRVRGRTLAMLIALLAIVALTLAACEEADEDVADVDDEPDEEPDEPDDDEPDDDEPDDDEPDDDEPDDEEPDDEEPDDEEPAADEAHLTLGTGSTGGTYYPLGGAIAGVWSTEIDGVNVSTQATGASVENARLITAGELDVGMAVNGVAADAYAGEGEFEGEDHDFNIVGNVYGEVMQVVAREDSGIETIADMEGQRVDLGPPGSGTEVLARDLLEFHDIDPEDDIEAFGDTFGDAADNLRDGQIDAAFAILALPAASIEEAATATDLNLVSIEGDPLDAALDADPTLSTLEVEPETYPDQEEPATFVTNWATMYAPSDMDEDLVYDLTRVLYDEREQIAEAHAVGEQIQIDTAVDGEGGIPLHPGAEAYYEEQDALD